MAPCTVSTDCASDECVSSESGQRYCSQRCTGDADCPAGMACPMGACEQLCTPVSTCGLCACKSGDRCARGSGCVPLSDVGGPCSRDADCKSQHCGTNSHTCDVEVGAPCTKANCELCEQWSNGVSYCSRSCSSADQCNGHGGICAGTLSRYTCNAQCSGPNDPSCGSGCELLSDGSAWICPCDVNCTTSREPGGLGAPCSSASDCKSGDCLLFGYQGVCSASCTRDADCGDGGACVACGASCGDQCLPTCDTTYCQVGQCSSGMRATGGSVRYCDAHLPDGAGCTASAQCASGRCGAGSTCIPAGGVASGQPCTARPADCSSGQCCNGKCC
jgi:hypothetical protein